MSDQAYAERTEKSLRHSSTRREFLSALSAGALTKPVWQAAKPARVDPSGEAKLTTHHRVRLGTHSIELRVEVPQTHYRQVTDAEHSFSETFEAAQQVPYITRIMREIVSRTSAPKSAIRAAQSLVARIPYVTDRESTGEVEYIRYPAETLVDEWEREKGTGACELNTLEQIPELYQHVIREAVTPYRADDLREQNRQALRGWVDEVRETLVESLREAGVPDDIDDLEAWLEEWNNYLADLGPVFDRLHEMQKRGTYDEWTTTLEETVETTEWPTVTVPEGEQLFPDDPLYDSNREYAENVRRVQQHKSGG